MLVHADDHHACMQADKSHQTADWRRRPLPKAMLQYAQTDTHYLLYLADLLRAKLIEAGDRIPPGLAVDLPQPGPQVPAHHSLSLNVIRPRHHGSVVRASMLL